MRAASRVAASRVAAVWAAAAKGQLRRSWRSWRAHIWKRVFRVDAVQPVVANRGDSGGDSLQLERVPARDAALVVRDEVACGEHRLQLGPVDLEDALQVTS